MVAGRDFPVENTPAGAQYLIPGTEKRTRPKSTKAELPREGNQYIIPGAEQISTKELLSRLAKKAIRPRRGQRGPSKAGLFWAIDK